jgi:hypothetical protein
MWCAKKSLAAALKTKAGRARINRALNQMTRTGSPALQAAIAKLPATFERKFQYCTAPGCCFSRARPGKPAQVKNGAATCGFCAIGEDGRLLAEDSPGRRLHLWMSLAIFAKKNQEVLGKAWGRLSEAMKRGCDNYMNWIGKEERREARERARMAANDPRPQVERSGMLREDYLSYQAPNQALRLRKPQRTGVAVDSMLGPRWVLQPPKRTCPHPSEWYENYQLWLCDVNAAAPPPCPPGAICRVCAEGFLRNDPKPQKDQYYKKSGLFDDDDQKRRAGRKAYERDLDRWEQKQPLHRVEWLPPGSLRELAMTRPSSRDPRNNDARGLFPDKPAAASSSAAAPSAAPPRRKRRRIEWPVSFTPQRQQIMRDMGLGHLVDAQLAQLEDDAEEAGSGTSE